MLNVGGGGSDGVGIYILRGLGCRQFEREFVAAVLRLNCSPVQHNPRSCVIHT
jgi:hypothetical protein